MQLSFEDAERKLSKTYILEKVTEEAIYKRFAPGFPKKSCKSPFREDKHDSFGFFPKKGHWYWKDLGGNGDHGDVFDYVMKDQKTDFQGALEAIASAFFITTEYTPIVVSRMFNVQAADQANQRSRSLIQVIRRDFESWEYGWWNRILIHKGLMEFYFIRAAKEVWVDKQLYWWNRSDNPIYYYLSPISKNIKAYRPEEQDKRRKWLSSQDPFSDIQGYWQCNIKRNSGKPLLLVKSLKECAFFRAFGFNAMANTSEHTSFHPDFIRHIRKYCFPIIYIGDNDWPGRKATLKIEKRYNIPVMLVPRRWGAKDPTDLWLVDYRKVYELLKYIYDYIEYLRIAGAGTRPAREFRHS